MIYGLAMTSFMREAPTPTGRRVRERAIHHYPGAQIRSAGQMVTDFDVDAIIAIVIAAVMDLGVSQMSQEVFSRAETLQEDNGLMRMLGLCRRRCG